MSEVKSELEIKRTLPELGAEIRAIHLQTQTMLLNASIELGRKLSEAKALCAHGEFMPWVKAETPFSQSTVNNLIRIFDEYGAAQYTLFGAEAKSQTLGNLTYSQALKLLAVPETEREEFAETVGAADMTTRELDKAIKERDAARELFENTNKKLVDAETARKNLKAELKAAKDDNAEKLKRVQQQLADAQAAAEAAAAPNDELIDAAVRTAVANELAKSREELESVLREKAEIEARAAELEKSVKLSNPFVKVFEIRFNELQDVLERLSDVLSDVIREDAEMGAKLKSAVLTVCERFAEEQA